MGGPARTALVTGASGGIGAVITRQLAAGGVSVAVHHVANADAARALAETPVSTGVELWPVQADVADPDQVSRMVDAVSARWGRVDILINNAAIAVPSAFEELSVGQWDRTLDVNLRGPFLCTQAVTPWMRRQGGGCVVNIASAAGTRMGGKTGADYSASKAGLVGFTLYAAAALHGDNIRVNCVAPGFTDTDMLTDIGMRGAVDHVTRPEDVASVVTWLCSPAAAAVQGQIVHIGSLPR